jgi:hypothetical protein
VWEDWAAGRGKMRAWRPGSAPVVLVEGPWHVVSVALSSDRIVWIGAFGDRALEGGYESAALYSSPLTMVPQDVRIQPGPVLPIKSHPARLATAANWAALTQCSSQEACVLLVADLTRNVVWRIPSRPGAVTRSVLAVSEREVLAAETPTSANGGHGVEYFEALLRYDLSLLDQYAERIVP